MTVNAETRPACAEPVLGETDLSLLSSLDGRFARVRTRHAQYGAADAPCVVLLGGISASRLAGEWWAAQVGPGRAIDTDRFRVLGIDFVDTLPDGWRGITPHDQAAALAGVLDALGIERVETIVGASYGGAVALSFAEKYPHRLRAALVLSMADRPSPMASALRAVQRDLLRLGEELGCEQRTVALARALAVTTYRSEAEFARRFAGDARSVDGVWRLPVEDYLIAQGERFAARFDARRYRLLSESLDLHRINPRRLRVPLYLLAVNEDRLVPRADIERLARDTDASLTCVASVYGHDAFLKETSAVGAWITSALAVALGGDEQEHVWRDPGNPGHRRPTTGVGPAGRRASGEPSPPTPLLGSVSLRQATPGPRADASALFATRADGSQPRLIAPVGEGSNAAYEPLSPRERGWGEGPVLRRRSIDPPSPGHSPRGVSSARSGQKDARMRRPALTA